MHVNLLGDGVFMPLQICNQWRWQASPPPCRSRGAGIPVVQGRYPPPKDQITGSFCGLFCTGFCSFYRRPYSGVHVMRSGEKSASKDRERFGRGSDRLSVALYILSARFFEELILINDTWKIFHLRNLHLLKDVMYYVFFSVTFWAITSNCYSFRIAALPKQVLHRARSVASSFILQHSVVPLTSSSSC